VGAFEVEERTFFGARVRAGLVQEGAILLPGLDHGLAHEPQHLVAVERLGDHAEHQVCELRGRRVDRANHRIVAARIHDEHAHRRRTVLRELQQERHGVERLRVVHEHDLGWRDTREQHQGSLRACRPDYRMVVGHVSNHPHELLASVLVIADDQNPGPEWRLVHCHCLHVKNGIYRHWPFEGLCKRICAHTSEMRAQSTTHSHKVSRNRPPRQVVSRTRLSHDKFKRHPEHSRGISYHSICVGSFDSLRSLKMTPYRGVNFEPVTKKELRCPPSLDTELVKELSERP